MFDAIYGKASTVVLSIFSWWWFIMPSLNIVYCIIPSVFRLHPSVPLYKTYQPVVILLWFYEQFIMLSLPLCRYPALPLDLPLFYLRSYLCITRVTPAYFMGEYQEHKLLLQNIKI